MLGKCLFCFIMLLSPYTFTAEAKPTLHVLIMCDTISSNIKKASYVDLKNMKEATSLIARYLKMQKKTTILKGKKLNIRPLSHWIQSLPISPNDVVIFYYSGHGFRQKTDITPWPSFVLPNTKSHFAIISGEKICAELKHLSSRFTLILFDCCNFEIPMKKIFLSPKSPMFSKHSSLPGLQSLFASTKGSVTIAASSPGEFAIAITGGKLKGSLFTSQFLLSLLQKCQKKDVTWHQVLKHTMSRCLDLSDKSQTPLGLIETE